MFEIARITEGSVCLEFREILVSVYDLLLNVHGAGNGVHYRTELGEYRVACVVHHMSVMPFDGRGNEIEIGA
jgi:hypothetical protein